MPSNLKKLKEITKVNEASILQDMTEIAGNDEGMQFANATGNLSQTNAAAKEKIEHVVSLHLMGISAKSILAQVNKLSVVKGWSKYKSETSIRGAISAHFKNYNKPVNLEQDEHLEGLKQGMFAQQEHIIEKASVFIADKDKKWTPFEYMGALKEVYAMRQQMIENKNWNDSRRNPNAETASVTNQLNIFIDNSTKIALGQVKNPALEALKLKLSDKFKQKTLDDE